MFHVVSSQPNAQANTGNKVLLDNCPLDTCPFCHCPSTRFPEKVRKVMAMLNLNFNIASIITSQYANNSFCVTPYHKGYWQIAVCQCKRKFKYLFFSGRKGKERTV